MKKLDKYIVLDLETTGLNPDKDYIIEIGAIKVEDDQIVSTFSKLINPKMMVSEKITEITGITNEMLLNEQFEEVVFPEFLKFISDLPLIGHNIINFDLRFLNRAMYRNQKKLLANEIVDTLYISRKLLNLKNHKLKTVAENFKIDYTGAHRATEDAKITNKVYQKLKELSN